MNITDETPTTLLLHRLARVLQLPEEARTAVEALGEKVNQGLLLEWVPNVERACSTLNCNQTWDQFQILLTNDGVFQPLRYACDQLNRLAPETVASEDELKEIRRQLVDLRADVLDADLTEELTSFLLRHIQDALWAIEAYDYRGTPALKNVLATTIGDVVLSSNVAAAASHEKDNSAILERFWRIFVRLAIVVDFAANLVSLPAVKPFLSLPAAPGLEETTPVIPPSPVEQGRDPPVSV